MATSRSSHKVCLVFIVASVSQLAATVSAQLLRGKAEASRTATEGPDARCEEAKARLAGKYSCGERLAYLTSAGSHSLNEGVDRLVNLEFPISCGDDLLFCRSPPPTAEAVALCSAAKEQAAGTHTCGHVLGDLRQLYTTDEAIDQLANYFEGACRHMVYCKDIALVPAPAAAPAPTPEPASEPTPATTLVPTQLPTPEPSLKPTPAPTLPTREPTPEPALVPDALCETAKARLAGKYSCGDRLAYLASAGSHSLNEGIDQLVNLEFPISCGDGLLFCRSPPPTAEAVALCSAAKEQAAGTHTCGHALGDLRQVYTTDEAIDQLANYFEGACRNMVYCKEIAFVPAPAATPAPTPEPASEPAPEPSEPAPRPSEEYDVIVVGSGLVGSAVAAKLSEVLPERTVLVLEAGKASQASLGGTSPPATWEHGQWTVWHGMQGNLTKYDIPGNYNGMHCWDKSCYHAFEEFPAYQCQVLGGCAVKNGALTQRPAPRMFDAWPQGWKWEDMLPYFEAVERDFSITDTPSADGRTYLAAAGTEFFKNALGASSIQEEDTFVPRGGTMGAPYVAAGEGIRESTASKYLPGALSRSNFELLLQSHVIEILHDDQGKASGVRYLHDNVEKQAKLNSRGILVLSAGALGSPGLLLQSGFQHLDAGIGELLSDHTYIGDRYSVPAGAITETFDYYNPPTSAKYLYSQERSGALAQYGPTLTAFFKDAQSPGGPEEFDVEAFVQPTSDPTELTVSFVLMRPTCSAGVVVASESEVRFKHGETNFHQACPRDTQIMDSAREQVRDAMRAVGATRVSSVGPYDTNHWAGSCSLGHCVSPDTLLVHGSPNIAIADASILPSQVWGHPAHTLRALALKAADTLVRTLREATDYQSATRAFQ